jgi:amidase
MAAEDLAFLPAHALARRIAAGEVASREVLGVLLDRIDRLDGPVNSVVALDAERATRAAAEADEAVARSDRLGPLHGVPMTVKDALETEGLVTTCGVPALAGHVPAGDAVAVARIKAAGAIVFGKTNVPMWAGDDQTYNDVYGVTSNPWDPSRTTSGSSGGAAAALACGFTPLEIGTDIGGSIRTPASHCGVVGHKPTWGIVPTFGYLPGPPGWRAEADLNVVGPLARDVADLRLALDVLAGPVEVTARAWSLHLPPAMTDGLRGLRVATWFDEPANAPAAEVRALLGRAADDLADAGADVRPLAPPAPYEEHRRLGFDLLAPILAREADPELLEFADELVRVQPEPAPDDGDIVLTSRGMAVRHRDWIGLDERRRRLQDAWDDRFRDVDVVLAPVQPVPAFPHDHRPITERSVDVDGEPRGYVDVGSAWALVFGLLHLPVTVVPVGRTAANLPVGVQIVGPRYADRTTMAVAEAALARWGGVAVPPGFEP